MADPTLLVVDEDPRVLNALRRLLMHAGYAVRIASEPSDAFSKLDNVGVVVSDFLMPEMNGLEFLRHVRMKRPQATRYMLTGSSGWGDFSGALAEGTVSAIFPKPWDDGMLLFAIRRGFELYAASEVVT